MVYVVLILTLNHQHSPTYPGHIHLTIHNSIRRIWSADSKSEAAGPGEGSQRIREAKSGSKQKSSKTVDDVVASKTNSSRTKMSVNASSDLAAGSAKSGSKKTKSGGVSGFETKSNSLSEKSLRTNTSRGLAAKSTESGSAAKNSSRQRYVIFVCDKRRSCGGWGDRQRGLVGVFLLALATGRRFGLIMTVPCNVTHFYTPNLVNWDIPASELKGKSSMTLDDVNSRLKLTARLKTMDFDEVYPQDVVYIRTNAEYWLGLRQNKLYRDRLPAWAKQSRAHYFSTGWRMLAKPSVSLQTRLKEFLLRIDFEHRKHPLVCPHVRVGRSATFKRDTEVRCNISTLPVLWDFVDRWVQNGSYVFMATDNWQVRNLTRQRFGHRMYDSGGEIIHVDQQARVPHACEGFESALLDQLILTYCDVLITSHSIFSQRASYLRGRSDNLFSFLKGKIRRIHI